MSVSTEYQEELNLKLGDTLQFDIAGETRSAAVSSVRKVKWDSFQPNFFLMFAPGLLDGTQGTWMTAAHMDAAQPEDHRATWCGASRASRCSTSTICCGQVRSIIDKALAAVQSVFLFTLLAGLVVLIAAVQASRDERRYESAMLRTLGANRSTVLKGLLAEFAALGVLSGTLAAAGASIAGVYIAKRVLQIPYSPDPWVWFYGLVGGGLLVCLAGWLATRSVVNQPPVLTLRSGVMIRRDRRRHRAMVGWYDPRVLMHSAYQVAIANIFGRHSDTRLIEALASQPQSEFDYSQHGGDFWLDYVADIGDGWNSDLRGRRCHRAARRSRSDHGGQREITRRRPRAGVRWRRGLSLSLTQRIRNAHRRRRTGTPSPAARAPMCSRFPATTTGTTAWSRSRARSAGPSAASPAARRARRAATSRCSCRPTGGCWPSTCSSVRISTSRRCSISRRSRRAWTTPRA